MNHPRNPQTSGKAFSHKSQRAKARWAILRDAILQDKVNVPSTTRQTNGSSEYSIHRFPGFQLLRRELMKKRLSEKDCNWKFTNNDDGTFDIVQYIIEVPEIVNKSRGKSIQILTRERRSSSKVTIKEMMSHVHYGVDNTGNTRVWDSSNVLAFIIMADSSESNYMQHVEPNVREIVKSPSRIDECSFISGLKISSSPPLLGLGNILSLSLPRSPMLSDSSPSEVLKVLELGAGMAALPGLALISLANSCEEYIHGNHSISVPYIDLTISDGHPAAVENNEICAKMTENLASELECNSKVTTTTKSAVNCTTLLWKANSEGASECANLMRQQSDLASRRTEVGFDLCLVSDCVHFTEFHADLVVTIGRILRTGGECILCQPCRGDSLRKFIALVDAMNGNFYQSPCKNEIDGDVNRPLFHVDLHMKYCRRLTNLHESLLKEHHNSKFYDPNIHYPLVLKLRKMRAYNEEVDTAIAVHHVKNR